MGFTEWYWTSCFYFVHSQPRRFHYRSSLYCLKISHYIYNTRQFLMFRGVPVIFAVIGKHICSVFIDSGESSEVPKWKWTENRLKSFAVSTWPTPNRVDGDDNDGAYTGFSGKILNCLVRLRFIDKTNTRDLRNYIWHGFRKFVLVLFQFLPFC